MSLLLGLALFTLAVLLYRYYLSPRPQKRKPPGPKGYPIVGSALQIKPSQIHEQFYDLACQYGPIFEVNMFGAKIVVLNSLDVINKAFYKEERSFSDRPKVFVADYINMQNSLLFRNADREHGFIKKSFVKGIHAHGNGITGSEVIVKREIDRVMGQIEDFDGKEFEVAQLVNRSLMNVMSILLVGTEMTDDDADNFAVYLAGQDFFMNPQIDTVLAHLPFLIHIPYIKRKLDKTIQVQRKLMERFFYSAQKSRTFNETRGLTDWFLNNHQGNTDTDCMLTDEVIKEILMTDVLSAGMATTSTGLPSIILCLVNHPGYQTKLQEEIDTVIGDKREPTVSDKHDCPFAEAVVMETLRYLTPAPFLIPHTCLEDFTFEGYDVEANSQILANAWYIHHDENIWGDPWTFRPERFLDDNGQLLPNSHSHMKSYVPFGLGRRKCPGMAMATTRIFLYLTSIFQRWTLEPSPGKCGSCDPRSGDFVLDVLIKPKPFYCIAKRRN